MATLTQATITGSELPTGDLIAYGQNLNTRVRSIYTCSSAGVITAQAIFPFPPSSFTSAPVLYKTLVQLPGSPALVISKFTRSDTGGIMVYGTMGVYPGVIGHSYSLGNPEELRMAGWESYVTVGEYFNPSFMIMGTSDYYYGWFGLGKTDSGQPNFYIIGRAGVGDGSAASSVTAINSGYCLADATGVLSFGSYVLNGNCYVLLNNLTGIVVSISKAAFPVPVYMQLAIPTGGEIKQFANGYYIATNAGGDMFLYNINNNGTLMAQLTGTYDPALSLELMTII